MSNQPNHPTEIEESVIAKIRQRREAGRKKYGTTMERTDLTRAQWIQHAQEEAMDLAIYLERLMREEADDSQPDPFTIAHQIFREARRKK